MPAHWFTCYPIGLHAGILPRQTRPDSGDREKNAEKTIFSNFLLTPPGSFTYTLFSRWAVVQLAGRRILTPLIKVRVLAAQPKNNSRPHRLAGPGQRPFTPSTGVQIPLGTPSKIKHLHKNVSAFFRCGANLPHALPHKIE